MQAGSDALPFRSAFKNVIFGKCLSLNSEITPGIIQNKLDGKGNFVFCPELCVSLLLSHKSHLGTKTCKQMGLLFNSKYAAQI